MNVFYNVQGVNSKPFQVCASPGCHVNLFLGPFFPSLPNRTETGIGKWAPLSLSLHLGLGLHRALSLNALLNQDLRTSIFPDRSMCINICSCTLQFHLTAYNIVNTVQIHTHCVRNVITYKRRKLVRHLFSYLYLMCLFELL